MHTIDDDGSSNDEVDADDVDSDALELFDEPAVPSVDVDDVMLSSFSLSPPASSFRPLLLKALVSGGGMTKATFLGVTSMTVTLDDDMSRLG